MKGSPYIRWAKSRSRIAYNLAAGGAPPRPLKALDPRPQDFEIEGENLDGWPPLLKAIAHRYGVEMSQVVTTHGNSMANHLVCSALLEPGDEVLVESPSYEPLRLLPAFLGAKVRLFHRTTENNYQIDPVEIEARVNSATKLIMLTNLHNPSGAVASRESLKALAELAEHRGINILVDEAYLEFLHDLGQPSAVLLSDRIIATRSLTKAYGLDGLRLGWILCRASLAERIRELNDLYSITTAHPSERLACRALERATQLLSPIRNLCDRNRWAVDSFVGLQNQLAWAKPISGSLGWIHLKNGSVDDLIQRLETQYDTSVAPGRFFGDEAYFRIGFGLPHDKMREGLDRLAVALREGS